MYILLLILPTLILVFADIYLKNNYKKYKDYDISSKFTGAMAAKKILENNGITDIKIVKVSGTLSDNFNPTTKTISLSSDIYDESSIASVSVAAHECGHVLQHKDKYLFIRLRTMLVPVVNLVTKIGYIVLIISYMLSMLSYYKIALITICASLLFQLVTLPVEFDASKRARVELLKLGIIDKDEVSDVKSMLNSAAFTYLAGFISELLELLRIVINLRDRK